MTIISKLIRPFTVQFRKSDLGPVSQLYYDVALNIITFLFMKSILFTVLAVFFTYYFQAALLCVLLPGYVFSYMLLKQSRTAASGQLLMIIEHVQVLTLGIFLGPSSGVYIFCFIYVVLAFFLFRDHYYIQRWGWVSISMLTFIVFPNYFSANLHLLPISAHPITQLLIICIAIVLISSILFMLQMLNHRCVNRLEVLYHEEEEQHQLTVDRLTYQHLFQNIVSGIADETRNPLAAIYNRIELMEGGSVDDSTEELIELVEQKLKRIVTLTQSMLKYSSAPSSQDKLDVNSIIYSVLNSLQDVITETNALVLQDMKSLPHIVGDSEKMFQVIYNVILNALESFNDTTQNEISIKTGVIDDEAFILVSDNGEGIEPSIYRSIFMPFFTTKSNRSGLGLAIAVQNVALFGGKILVESNQGFGTSFRIVIPIRRKGFKKV